MSKTLHKEMERTQRSGHRNGGNRNGEIASHPGVNIK